MSIENLNEIQLKLLEIFEWFHHYCSEHNLQYYAIGGTMLGAARHQGFIPWDDDIDIGMPREDYSEFCRLMLEVNNNTRYVGETIYMQNTDYYYPYTKVYDTSTTLIENKRRRAKRGVFIDIFPIDGTGNTLEESEEFFKPIGMKLDFFATKVCAVRKGRSLLKNSAVIIMQLIPKFIYDENKEKIKIDNLCKSKSYKNCKYVANMYGLKRSGEIMQKGYFGTPTLYQFENLQIYGVEKYDEFLTHIYGEWRNLPPTEEQKTHHDYFLCDLSRSYFD